MTIYRAKEVRPWPAYQQSKLADLLFALETARAAAGSRLRSIPVHPGVSRTNLSPMAADRKTCADLSWPHSDAVGQGGRVPPGYTERPLPKRRAACTSALTASRSGGSPTIEVPRPQALDEAVAKRLWTVSEELTGVVYPPLT